MSSLLGPVYFHFSSTNLSRTPIFSLQAPRSPLTSSVLQRVLPHLPVKPTQVKEWHAAPSTAARKNELYIQVEYCIKGFLRVSSQSKRQPSVLLSARLKECILTSLNSRYEEIFLTVWTLLLSDLSSLSTKYTRTQEYRHFIFSIWILLNQKCTIYMIA